MQISSTLNQIGCETSEIKASKKRFYLNFIACETIQYEVEEFPCFK
jgi:hypothetical protein